jgi:iron complex outermembrane receptor protein
MSANDKNPTEERMLTQQCPFPDEDTVNSPAQPNQDVGQLGCASAAGAFYAAGIGNITTRNVPAYSDNQNIAFFGELQLPILDNFNVSLSGRHEDFNGGDLQGDIYSVAGKYDITDNFYVRASYSTNYRAEAALDTDPGTIAFGNSVQTRFASQVVPTATQAQAGLHPEEDFTTNLGAGFRFDDVFGGRLRGSVDYFKAEITGQVATASITTILTNVFGVNVAACQTNRADTSTACTAPAGAEPAAGLGAAATNVNTQFANCTSRLRQFVVFNNNNTCTQNTTRAADIAGVNLATLNGPDFTTEAIDYSLDYSHDLFDGTFSVSLAATQTIGYDQGPFNVNGAVFDAGGDRLGLTNLGNSGLASVSQKWKGNMSLRWANDNHNINLRANYASGSLDERYASGGLIATQLDNPATTTVNETTYSTWGVQPDPSLTFDATYIYTAPFWKELQLTASIINLTDEDPTPLQVRSGYYNGSADPRGRIVEIGLTKKF